MSCWRSRESLKMTTTYGQAITGRKDYLKLRHYLHPVILSEGRNDRRERVRSRKITGTRPLPCGFRAFFPWCTGRTVHWENALTLHSCRKNSRDLSTPRPSETIWERSQRRYAQDDQAKLRSFPNRF